MIKPDIYPVLAIGKGSLSVMAKPVAGEWIEEEFEGISRTGIHRIVSLLESQEARELGLGDEKMLCEKFGMEFVSFPIRDMGLPVSLEDYVSLTDRLYKDALRGLNTVVHCRAGIGRTGVVAAGILLHNGYDPTAAFALISAKRGVSVPDTLEQLDWVINNHVSISGWVKYCCRFRRISMV